MTTGDLRALIFRAFMDFPHLSSSYSRLWSRTYTRLWGRP